MARYLIKRLALIIPTFIGITMITYGMVRLAPGDYAMIRAGVDGSLQQNALNKDIFENEKKLFGLDKPIYVGYVEWFGKLVCLDFGISRKDGRPVTERIAQALPVTILLNLITMLVAYIISIPLGIATAVKRNSKFDRITALLLFVFYSLPAFWVGLLLMIVFSSGEYLNWFPLGGIISDGISDFNILEKGLNLLWHLVLPVATLTYGSFAFLSRYVRANMLDVINQQYITAAVARGLDDIRVVCKHAFVNSLIPLVTLMASILPALLGGSVIVESIFSIPGMGMLAFEAILSRDIPVIMAIASISAILTLLGILLADLTYGLVDPRIRVGAAK